MMKKRLHAEHVTYTWITFFIHASDLDIDTEGRVPTLVSLTDNDGHPTLMDEKIKNI